LLTNTSSVTLYISEQTNVTAAFGFPLAPNGTKEWPLGNPLHARADSGTGTLFVSVLGDVTNPLAVGQATATQLLTSGLAAAIAAEIKLAGVPPIDEPVVLASGTVATPLALGIEVDVSRYQSVSVVMDWTNSSASTTSVVRANVKFRAGGSAGLSISEPDFCFANGWTVTARLPIVGDWLSISIDAFTGYSPVIGDNVTYRVVGSYRTVSEASYRFDPQGRALGGPYTGFSSWPVEPFLNSMDYGLSVAGLATVELAIPHNSGPASFTTCISLGAITIGTANFAICRLRDAGTFTEVHNRRATVVNDSRCESIILPPQPLKLALRNNSNTTAATYFTQLNSQWLQ
jgi:hypothetical protein